MSSVVSNGLWEPMLFLLGRIPTAKSKELKATKCSESNTYVSGSTILN